MHVTLIWSSPQAVGALATAKVAPPSVVANTRAGAWLSAGTTSTQCITSAQAKLPAVPPRPFHDHDRDKAHPSRGASHSVEITIQFALGAQTSGCGQRGVGSRVHPGEAAIQRHREPLRDGENARFLCHASCLQAYDAVGVRRFSLFEGEINRLPVKAAVCRACEFWQLRGVRAEFVASTRTGANQSVLSERHR